MKQIVPMMMMLVVGLNFVAASAEIETVNLQPRFELDRVTRYEFWTQRDQHTTMQFMNNERAVDQKIIWTGEIIWEITKVQSDGSAECEMTFDWLSMEITAGEGTSYTLDTRKGPGDMAEGHRYLKAMTNKSLTVHVNADGSIEKILGVQAITRALAKSNDPPDERDFEESATNLATLVAAPAASTVGESWKCDFTWNHEAGSLKYKTRYTLDDVGELEGIPVAMIRAESTLKMEFDRSKFPPPPGAPPVNFKFTPSQKTEQIIYDFSRGEVIARHNTQTISYAMTLRLPQGSFVRKVKETTVSQIIRIAE